MSSAKVPDKETTQLLLWLLIKFWEEILYLTIEQLSCFLIRYLRWRHKGIELKSKRAIDSHLILEKWPFCVEFLTFRLLLLKTWRNRLNIKNNNRISSNTRGIPLLHSIFDVLTINGNLYWKRKNRLKIKKTKFFFVKQHFLNQNCVANEKSLESLL